MLREITDIKQNDEEGFRRWFTSDDMDLFVWYNDDCRVTSFQLCQDEYLISWSIKKGMSFSKNINDSAGPLNYKGSTVLRPIRPFSLKRVFDSFVSRSRRINRELVRFIINILIREEILLQR